jgi:predicted transcriptional regulator
MERSVVANVIVVKKQWAAKILAGSKTIEVRTRAPPNFSPGALYGIAVAGIPDLVFGLVRIDSTSPPLCFSTLESLEPQTQVAVAQLRAYLKGDTGVCWYLSGATAFAEPVLYYSDGQGCKGAPRHRKQPDAELRMLQASPLTDATEQRLLRSFAYWQQTQRSQAQARRAHKACLFKEERAARARPASRKAA